MDTTTPTIIKHFGRPKKRLDSQMNGKIVYMREQNGSSQQHASTKAVAHSQHGKNKTEIFKGHALAMNPAQIRVSILHNNAHVTEVARKRTQATTYCQQNLTRHLQIVTDLQTERIPFKIKYCHMIPLHRSQCNVMCQAWRYRIFLAVCCWQQYAFRHEEAITSVLTTPRRNIIQAIALKCYL